MDILPLLTLIWISKYLCCEKVSLSLPWCILRLCLLNAPLMDRIWIYVYFQCYESHYFIVLHNRHSSDLPKGNYLKEMCAIYVRPEALNQYLSISLPVPVFQWLPVLNLWLIMNVSTVALFHVINSHSALAVSFPALMDATVQMVSFASQILLFDSIQLSGCSPLSLATWSG